MAVSEYTYADITANGTFTLKTGQGALHDIVVNAPGSAWTLAVYDSTGGATSPIAHVTVTATAPLLFDVEFVNGLTIVAAGTTPGDATVTFE